MSVVKNESKAKSLRMVEIDHQQFAVELISDNVSVNLTQMAKPFGNSKRPVDWLKTDDAKAYVAALSEVKKITSADLVIVKKGNFSNKQEQGTWVTDYRLAMRFAQWLSPEFSIQVDQLLVDLLMGDLALVRPFNGTMPVVVGGKAYYYQLDVLRGLGFSTRSGMVSQRKRRFPQHFVKLYGRNFVTIDFCNYLKNRRAIVQLDIDFAVTERQLQKGARP